MRCTLNAQRNELKSAPRANRAFLYRMDGSALFTGGLNQSAGTVIHVDAFSFAEETFVVKQQIKTTVMITHALGL